MTVEIEINKKLFDHNGVSPSVSFTFRVLQNSDLKYYTVDKTNPLATLQLQTEDVNYSLALNEGGEGGVVTFLGGVPNSDYRGILITEYAFTQPSDLPTEGNFSEESVEAMADRATLLCIQIKEQLDRTLRFPLGDTATVSELPSTGSRAGGLFAFDANGNVTTVQLTELEQLAVSSYFAQLASAADASSALIILGIPYNPASAASPASFRFYEDSDNGSNYLDLIAPDALASSGNLRMPSGPSTLASIDLAELFSNKKFQDSTVTFVDNADNTKQLAIQCSGISPGVTRTLQAPDKDGEIATLSDIITLLPKSTPGAVTTDLLTGIPPTAKRIVINFIGLTKGGTGDIAIQVGPSSGVVSSGYIGGAFRNGSSAGNTTCIYGNGSWVANGSIYGSFVLELADASSNTWVWHGSLWSAGGFIIVPSGLITLSGELERILITDAGGTPGNFSGGSWSVSYS